MHVRLHTDLNIVDAALCDRTLDIRYVLSNDAFGLLCLLLKQPDIELLTPLVIRKFGVSKLEARHAIYTLLGQLDVYGGIHVGRLSVFGWLQRVWTGGFWRARYNATLAGFMRSMLRAYGVFALLGMAFSAALLWTTNTTVPFYWVLLPVLLLTTCVIHEAGHACTARLLRIPYVFLAKPGLAAVLYRQPARSQEQLVALCGPLAAAVVCTIAALCIPTLPARLISVAAAVIHLYSLSPWVADGKTIWSRI